MKDLQEKIKSCKTLLELDQLRSLIIQAMEKENNVQIFEETQALFLKQKNKIKRHGGILND